MTKPLITGSFLIIQHPNIWEMPEINTKIQRWDAKQWRHLVRDMAKIGIDTIIISNMALWAMPLFPKSGLGPQFPMGCEDPALVIAEEAACCGIKIYYGIGLHGRVCGIGDYKGYEKPWPDYWFRFHDDLTKVVMERYSSTDSFGGLYLSTEFFMRELDNGQVGYREEEMEFKKLWIKTHLRPIVGRTLLLSSPAVSISIPGKMDEYTKQLEMMDIDIIAYQDKCGGFEETGYKELPKSVESKIALKGEVFAALAEAHAKTGVKIWANCETFSMLSSSYGFRKKLISGELCRIEKQLEVCAPHVDKIITWLYQGIWNRQSKWIDIGGEDSQNLYDHFETLRRKVLR